MSLLKYAGNLNKSPEDALQQMNEKKCEFITWRNGFADKSFIAKKSTVEKLAYNKTVMNKADRVVIEDKEYVSISETGMTIDEIIYEMDALKTDEVYLCETFNNQQTKIKRKSLNLLREILFNPKFNHESLF